MNKEMTSDSQDGQAARQGLIAAPLHTILVLTFVLVNAYLSKARMQEMQAAGSMDHVKVYLRTIVVQWLLLAVVLAGVWLKRSSLAAVLGDRWHSALDVLRDLGIAVAFLVFSITVNSLISSFAGGHGTPDPSMQYLLPRGHIEVALWVLLSITAGICEEAIYRGYIQRQFTAIAKSSPLGIFGSAVLFGVSHSYQGLGHALGITLLGVMLGILAYKRKSVRPGMMAHTLQDLLPLMINH